MSGFILNRGKSFAAKYKEIKENPKEPSPKPTFDSDNDSDVTEVESDVSSSLPTSPIKKSKISTTKSKVVISDDDNDANVSCFSDDQGDLDYIDDRPDSILNDDDIEELYEESTDSDDSDIAVIASPDSITNDRSIGRQMRAEPFINDSIESPSSGHNMNNLGAESPETLTIKLKYNGKIHRVQVYYNETLWKHVNEFYQILEINKKTHQLIVTHNDRVLTFNETPKSLTLTITDILECFAKDLSLPNRPKASQSRKQGKTKNKVDADMLKIKFRNNKDGKNALPKVLTIKKNCTFERIMKEYSDLVDYPLDKLIFDFDGERLTGEETPIDLDMEDGSLIDVLVKD